MIVLVAVPFCGTNFSVKRRMRPARRIVFRWDSLNAFIPRLAESEGFFVVSHRDLPPPLWSLNRKTFRIPAELMKETVC